MTYIRFETEILRVGESRAVIYQCAKSQNKLHKLGNAQINPTIYMLQHVQKLLNMNCHYFLASSHKNTRWVSNVFMWHKKRRSRRFDLEKEHGFRLVIHERDWIAGRTIRANITDSIDKSRRVIFIVSR